MVFPPAMEAAALAGAMLVSPRGAATLAGHT